MFPLRYTVCSINERRATYSCTGPGCARDRTPSRARGKQRTRRPPLRPALVLRSSQGHSGTPSPLELEALCSVQTWDTSYDYTTRCQFVCLGSMTFHPIGPRSLYYSAILHSFWSTLQRSLLSVFYRSRWKFGDLLMLQMYADYALVYDHVSPLSY